jgi:hypothetical protein
VYFLQFFLLNMKWWKIVKKTAQNMKFIIFWIPFIITFSITYSLTREISTVWSLCSA